MTLSRYRFAQGERVIGHLSQTRLVKDRVVAAVDRLKPSNESSVLCLQLMNSLRQGSLLLGKAKDLARDIAGDLGAWNKTLIGGSLVFDEGPSAPVQRPMRAEFYSSVRCFVVEDLGDQGGFHGERLYHPRSTVSTPMMGCFP